MDQTLQPLPRAGGTSSIDIELRDSEISEIDDLAARFTVLMAVEEMDDHQKWLFSVLAWGEAGRHPMVRKLMLAIIATIIVALVVLAASRDILPTVITVLAMAMLAGFLLGRRRPHK